MRKYNSRNAAADEGRNELRPSPRVDSACPYSTPYPVRIFMKREVQGKLRLSLRAQGCVGRGWPRRLCRSDTSRLLKVWMPILKILISQQRFVRAVSKFTYTRTAGSNPARDVSLWVFFFWLSRDIVSGRITPNVKTSIGSELLCPNYELEPNSKLSAIEWNKKKKKEIKYSRCLWSRNCWTV